MKWAWIVLISLFCFVSIGFAVDPLSFKQALKKYHRHGEFFNRQNLHANIFWDVVYKDKEFREAMSRVYAEKYQLSESELQSRIWNEYQEAERGPEFVVILYTYDKKWNDLDSRESIWRLRLEREDQEYTPVSVVKVKPTPTDETFYPFSAPWTQMYVVLFPKGSLSGSPQNFKLTLYGLKGQNTLTWNLAK